MTISQTIFLESETSTVKTTIDAIFENGVFRPLKAPGIPQGKQVKLEVDIPDDGSPGEILALATTVFDGLSEEDMGEIESIALDRRDFFDNGTQ